MAQRFTKLYELPSGCYAPCAPVMIRAGALLRDNYSKNAVVQLRLYNLDERTIRGAVTAISRADVLIIGGTSLAVYPAAGFISYFDGSDLILINRDPTPQDRNASVIIRDPIAQVMAALD